MSQQLDIVSALFILWLALLREELGEAGAVRYLNSPQYLRDHLA